MSISFDTKYKEQYKQVCSFINQDKYTYSKHAISRMREREVSKAMIHRVVSCGKHESTWDRWDCERESWSYCFQDIIGKKDIFVIIGIETDTCAKIITVVDRCFYGMDCLPSVGSFKQEEAELTFDDLLDKKARQHTFASLSSEKDSPTKAHSSVLSSAHRE